MRFVLDRASLILEGTHDDIVVPITMVLPDGREIPAGTETVSDAEATELARRDAARRPDESIEDYEKRVLSLVTWSQEHVRQLAAARRGNEVELRPIAEIVLAVDAQAEAVEEST